MSHSLSQEEPRLAHCVTFVNNEVSKDIKIVGKLWGDNNLDDPNPQGAKAEFTQVLSKSQKQKLCKKKRLIIRPDKFLT